MPETMSKSEFAEHIGHSPGHVTKLIADGRIVLAGSGRNARVKVDESLALMQRTGGTRMDVAMRHAQERAAKAQTEGAAGNHATPAEKIERGAIAQATGSNDGGADKVGSSYQAARAVKEKYAALTAKAEYETLMGNLIAREDVDAVLRFVGATVRSLLDVFPDQYAPVLCATTDIHETHAALTDACRAVMDDIGLAIERQKQTITKG